MSWWSTSWLPSIPSIDFALPSGIQKRFISFALRQTLGHLLKPGQLDIQQVDSQIGSGYVQLRDLELDNNAINALLVGLPLELHDGSVGKATARIPLPNPLTSSVGLSLESLHLTFNVSPTISTVSHPENLVESMVSVAETFIHDELNDIDETRLRESLHGDLSWSSQSLDPVPGGLDPFLSDRETGTHEYDPPGVSIFATLVERLLARFEFDASDIKITLVHPGHSSFTLTVPSIRYNTELQDGEPPMSSTNTTEHRVGGVTRTIHISGVNVTTRCLRPLSPQPLMSPATSITSRQSTQLGTPSTVTPQQSPPQSPSLSDSSDMDEDTTLMMSQSIIGLPQRPISPSSSVASSMYESAISTAPVASTVLDVAATQPEAPKLPSTTRSSSTPTSLPPPPPLHVLTNNEIEDETILSFGVEPIVLQLVAPSPARSTSPPAQPYSSSRQYSKDGVHEGSSKGQDHSNSANPLRFEATIGVLAVALRARHIRSLVDMADLWTSHSPESATTAPPSQNASGSSRSILDHVDASVRIRGIVILFLPANSILPAEQLLTEFYKRPLVSPHLPHGFVRVHIESITASLSTTPMVAPLTTRLIPSYSGTITTGHLSVSEISAFTFLHCFSSVDGTTTVHASPLLITDQNLALQYPTQHIHPDLRQAHAQHVLPPFDVIDWTNPLRQANTAKLSTWRTRAPQGTSSSPGTPISKAKDLGSSPFGRSPVLQSPARQSPSSKRHSLISPLSQSSAIHVQFTLSAVTTAGRSSKAKSKAPESGLDIDVQVAPLHLFCDSSLLLNKGNPAEPSELLLFIDEIATQDLQTHPLPEIDALEESGDEDTDEADTPPATPRAQPGFYSVSYRERKRERERQRLERLVLEDLDLELDYRQSNLEEGRHTISRVDSWRKKQTRRNKKTHTSITIKLPVLRLEVRNPPPPALCSRSGAIVLDIHDLRICPGDRPTPEKKASLRFTDTEDLFPTNTYLSPDSNDATIILSASWQRLAFAYAAVGETKAQMILSVGPLSPGGFTEMTSQGIDIGSPSSHPIDHSQQLPQVVISKASSAQSAVSSGMMTTVMSIEIPSVHVHLGKLEFDGLQLWADDLTQTIERALHPEPVDLRSDKESQKDPSLIGSRFFNKARRSQGSGNGSVASTVNAPRTNADGETIVKIIVSEVAVTLSLPRKEGGLRPFNVVASDIDVLLELKPEGKDETVLTLGVADVCIRETSSTDTLLTFLSLTTPRNGLSNATQSLLKLRFTSLVVSDSAAKESRIKVTLCGLTYTLHPDLTWVSEMTDFIKAPPGVFESVVPSERTQVSLKVVDSSIRALCPTYPGALVLHLGELDFSTVMIGNLPELSFHLLLQAVSLFLVDDINCTETSATSAQIELSRVSRSGGGMWKVLGYALIAELVGVDLASVKNDTITPPAIKVDLTQGTLRLHLCADTGAALGALIGDFSSIFAGAPTENPVLKKSNKGSSVEVSHRQSAKRDLTASLDEFAFRRTVPQVGAAPDMINDDLPSNLEYLDDSFSASAGLRELNDGDFDDFEDEAMQVNISDQTGVISAYGGETVRLLDAQGLQIVENYFETLPPEAMDESKQYGDTTLKVRIQDFDAAVFLYDGYDWVRTRKIIEEEAREMRRRLAKIRQLVASGQTPDPTVEETNTLLFNSVYIGLEHNVDELEPGALIAAIDKELDEELETASQSSWQSLKHQPTSPVGPGARTKRLKKRLTRSKGPSIEFRLQSLLAEVDNYRSHESLASRILVTVRDVEILDHIKTSTWSKFLTSLHTDSRGNIRETGSNMIRVELRKVYPVPGNPAQEARLRAKILPLRLHVDQDALDFMKKFFSFKDPDAAPPVPTDPTDEMYFQQAEVFPVDLKLDYKPRRVDYRALRDGKTIELMNFFHFDGAEMTLRHITLNGITGWARLGDLLNDLWTPDVKATQLVDVISGVAPIRSVVNVGSGVADLVLLPIAQYKKDGRVVRGLQKGTTAFVKSTATEAIKLGARLATGTQVILEQAENVIGGQFKDPITAEALQMPSGAGLDESFGLDMDAEELISRYADQPTGVKDGVKSAYKSLRRNLNSAAQTILAVPMEVYERSGNEGAVRAVVRAVPIAVLKPMIGASEAVSKTLLGLHNTLDPNVRTENEAKYKQR